MSKCESCYNMECVFVDNQIPFFDSENCQNYRGLTNADKIRAMTDEELANEIIKIVAFCAPGHRPSPDCCCNCQKCWLDWLKSPVEEDE